MKQPKRGKSRRSLDLIEAAYHILDEIQPASIRAVCYRLFVLNITTNMSKSETSRVSVQLTYAREQGIIPWHWIVDETREVEQVPQWTDATTYALCVSRAYRRDRWSDQPRRVEVWSEKGTIRGTLRPVLDTYGVAFRVMHGYGSATALHDAADDSTIGDKTLEVLYLGDWDPSGLHMSVLDIPARISRYNGHIELDRVALTAQDVAGTLPSFEAETKKGDKRYQWFRREYGDRCWELDALSPVVLRERVESAIVERIDPDAWERAEVVERAEQESITSILGNWPTAEGISGQAQKYSQARRSALAEDAT